MKETIKKSIVGAITFSLTTFTIFVVYALVDSSWTTPSTLEVGTGSGLSATAWNKLLSNFNNLNDKVSNCPTGMTKVSDFCIDNTAVIDVAGEDQKMAMTRCKNNGKHLCSYGEYKTAWITNASLICPGGVGRYVTPEMHYVSAWYITTFECTNCSTSTIGCVGSNAIATDSSDKSLCCLNR